MPRLRFKLGLIATLLTSSAAAAVAGSQNIAPLQDPCELARQHYIEVSLSTSDDMGHGPDIGSGEWHSVVESYLGISGDDDIPDHGTEEWCSYIENALATGDA